MSRRQQTHGGAQHHKVRTFLRWSRLIENGQRPYNPPHSTVLPFLFKNLTFRDTFKLYSNSSKAHNLVFFLYQECAPPSWEYKPQSSPEHGLVSPLPQPSSRQSQLDSLNCSTGFGNPENFRHFETWRNPSFFQFSLSPTCSTADSASERNSLKAHRA